MEFEWDESKARVNLKKHKVSFEEAKTVFNDPFLITFPDPEHSEDEERYLSIGLSARDRVFVVVHTDRGENIRLINGRKATLRERRFYEQSDL
jgi:uncharacterized DUF497 family protein